MGTIFKVGMVVYDQVFFGKTPLKIIEVKEDMSLRVLYGEVVYCYTGDGRFIGDEIISNRHRGLSQTPTLSTSPYTLEGFEQKAKAPTFEEVWEKADKVYEAKSEEVCKGYPSQELADASEALRKLLFLKDYYNDGWQPEPDLKGKADFLSCIVNYCGYTLNEVSKDRTFSVCRVMIFKTEEIRDKFLEEQRELLEIARPLL